MPILKSFCSAFLMYSAIPVPQVAWKEENRRYALCFFPFIGVVIGFLLMVWYHICRLLDAGPLLFAAICAAIPVLVTGGIHLDGFCDVCDATASCGTKDKLLAIMSDPHIGSFAAIKLGVYLMVQAGLFARIDSLELMAVCSLCFVQSRALSGLAAVTFKSVKGDGALQHFARPAHKGITVMAEIVFLILMAVGMIAFCPPAALGAMTGAGAAMLYYRHFSYKKFGGITGDLAGWFLQMCELSAMACAVLLTLIWRACI